METASPTHKPLIDEVLRKIGRNLIIYQQIEALIRSIGSGCRQAGYVKDLTKNHEAARQKLSKKPMGDAAHVALKHLFGSSEPVPPPGGFDQTGAKRTFPSTICTSAIGSVSARGRRSRWMASCSEARARWTSRW